MEQYHDLLKRILKVGTDKPAAREGMPGTKSLFGHQFRHNLDDGFPLLTTKKMYWKGVVVELLWFLRGDTNVKYLIENGVNIWNEDAYAYYCKIASANGGEEQNDILWKNLDGSYRLMTFEEFSVKLSTVDRGQLDTYGDYTLGDCGHQYGKVWREWEGHSFFLDKENGRSTPIFNTVDQIRRVLNNLRKYPESRRHIVTAVDPTKDDKLALYWCHSMFQFNCRPMTEQERFEWAVKDGLVTDDTDGMTIKEFMDSGRVPKYFLDCQLYQRSADVFLGVPFNIASYALLTHLFAQLCNMAPGEFVHTFGDVHIYDNHREQVKEQLSREPYELPQIRIDSGVHVDSPIDVLMELRPDHFKLVGYSSHPKIEAELSTGINK